MIHYFILLSFWSGYIFSQQDPQDTKSFQENSVFYQEHTNSTYGFTLTMKQQASFFDEVVIKIGRTPRLEKFYNSLTKDERRAFIQYIRLLSEENPEKSLQDFRSERKRFDDGEYVLICNLTDPQGITFKKLAVVRNIV